MPDVEVVAIPESETTCGLLAAESTRVNVPKRFPVASGLKRIAMLQLADAAKVEPHVVVVMMKSPALVPLTLMLLKVTELDPPFVTAMDFDAP